MSDESKCTHSCCCESCDPLLTRALSGYVEELVAQQLIIARRSGAMRAMVIESLLSARRPLRADRPRLEEFARPAQIPEALAMAAAKEAVSDSIVAYASNAGWDERQMLLATVQVMLRTQRSYELAMKREIDEQRTATMGMLESIDMLVDAPLKLELAFGTLN